MSGGLKVSQEKKLGLNVKKKLLELVSDYIVRYKNVKSLYCIHETNIM